jgi:predicted amidohydrolase
VQKSFSLLTHVYLLTSKWTNSSTFKTLNVVTYKANRVRAFENAAVLAMANYAAPYMNGRSCAFSPNATTLVEADGTEGVYLSSIDMAAVRAYRAQTIWGDAFRRPYRYQAITTLKKNLDFQLPNFFSRDRLF